MDDVGVSRIGEGWDKELSMSDTISIGTFTFLLL